MKSTVRHICAVSCLSVLALCVTSMPTFAQASGTQSTDQSHDAEGCPPQATIPSEQQFAAIAGRAKDRGFLWSISKGGHSSYLYGTVHVARLEWMFPGPKVMAALRASDTLALELDMSDEKTLAALMNAMAPAPGTPDLPAAVTRRLQMASARECIDFKGLQSFRPEMQVMTLTTLIGRRDGLDPAYAIDLFLAGVARGSGRVPVALETPQQQMDAFLPIGDFKDQMEFVVNGLEQLEDGKAQTTLKRLTQVWADSDLQQLSNYTAWCECVRTPAELQAMERLNDQRNPAIADGIAALHEDKKSVFAAVGALHMIGPASLPLLLKQRGYEVTRITFGP